jgi:hypothetical protein
VTEGVLQEARLSKAQRLSHRRENFSALRERFPGIYEGDLAYIRGFVPLTSSPERQEAELASAGFRLILLTSKAFTDVANPIAVWVREIADPDHPAKTLFEAELYGGSQLGVVASSERQALLDFIELLRLVKTDLDEVASGNMSEDLRQLHSLLRHCLSD